MRNLEEKSGLNNTLNESGHFSRREFIKAAGLFISSLATGPVLLTGCGFSETPQLSSDTYQLEGDRIIVKLDTIPGLSVPGNAVSIVRDSREISVIIARTGKDDFVVASNQCTHRERPMGYDAEAAQLVCSSGKSRFTLDGMVIKGPAEKPLLIYEWKLEQRALVIYL